MVPAGYFRESPRGSQNLVPQGAGIKSVPLFLTNVTHFEHFWGPRCRTGAGTPWASTETPQGAPRDTPGSSQGPSRDPPGIPGFRFGCRLVPFWFQFGSHLGSSLVPVWCRFGSDLVPVYIHFGSIVGSVWSHFGPSLFPSWFPFRFPCRPPFRFPFTFPSTFPLRFLFIFLSAGPVSTTVTCFRGIPLWHLQRRRKKR